MPRQEQRNYNVQLPDGRTVSVEASSREEAVEIGSEYARRGSLGGGGDARQNTFATAGMGQVAQAGETLLYQAAPAAAQTPLSALNSFARAWPGNYDWSQGPSAIIPGSGAYNAPLPTREEVLGGIARRTGMQQYGWQGGTPASRLTQAAGSAALEGGLIAGALRGAPMVARAVTRGQIPSRTELAYGTRDVAYSGMLDAASAATGVGISEITDNPYLGMAAGLAVGGPGARVGFSQGRAARDVNATVEGLTRQEIDQARTILAAADRMGIELTGMDAISLASSTAGPRLNNLYREAVNLLGDNDPALAVRRRNVGEGPNETGSRYDTGQFGTTLNRILADIRRSNVPVNRERTAIRAQRAATSAVGDARTRGRALYGPIYRRLETESLPPNFISNLQGRLRDRATVASGPKAQNAETINALADELSGIQSVAQFDDWFRTYTTRTTSTDPRTQNPISTNVGGIIGEVISSANTSLELSSNTLRQARRQFGDAQENIVSPVTRAVGNIADRDGQQNARTVVRSILDNTEMEPEVLQRGFNAILQQDPQIAADLLAIHVQNSFRQSWRAASTSQSGGRPSPLAASNWRDALIGSEENLTAMRSMFNSLDQSRSLPSGTTWEAFNNLMRVAQASGQLRSYGVSAIRQGGDSPLEAARAGGVVSQSAAASPIPVLNVVGRNVALALYNQQMDRIVDQLTRTGPGAVDNVLRLAESRFGSRAMLEAATYFTSQANILEANQAAVEQQQ